MNGSQGIKSFKPTFLERESHYTKGKRTLYVVHVFNSSAPYPSSSPATTSLLTSPTLPRPPAATAPPGSISHPSGSPLPNGQHPQRHCKSKCGINHSASRPAPYH